MISIINVKRYCDDDITQIENYETAINSDEMWDCHHRLEAEGSVTRSRQQLKDDGLYYSRPPSELIFLSKKQHSNIHKRTPSIETRRKISEARKNDPSNLKRLEDMRKKAFTPEAIRKRVESRRTNWSRKDHSESFNKIRLANIGKHWYNNGVEECFQRECPIGFVAGRLPTTEETRNKMSLTRRGKPPNNKGKPAWNRGKRLVDGKYVEAKQ